MNKLLVAILLWATYALPQTNWILHVTQDGGAFSTQVVLRNDFGAPLPYHLAAYDREGQLLGEVDGWVAALGSQAHDSQTFFGLVGVSHFSKSDDTLVTVSVAYQAKTEDAGIAKAVESGARSDLWYLQPGHPDRSWDGLAVVNLGDDATPINITQRDEMGVLIQTAQIQTALVPHGKALYVLSTDFDLSIQYSFFEIQAEQAVGVLALRGTPDNALLWQNLALPHPLDSAPSPQEFGGRSILFRPDVGEDLDWEFPDTDTGFARNLNGGGNAAYRYEKPSRNAMILELDLQPTRVFRMSMLDGMMGLYQAYEDDELIDQGSFWMYP